MSGIQRQHYLAAGGIAQIELVGTDGVALCTNAEQFAFHRVDMVAGIQRLAENLIQRA
ncbi:hypothetical protein D3C81_661860 [compost metagenome]